MTGEFVYQPSSVNCDVFGGMVMIVCVITLCAISTTTRNNFGTSQTRNRKSHEIQELKARVDKLHRAVNYLSQRVCRVSVSSCSDCHQLFNTRNELFRHLKENPEHQL